MKNMNGRGVAITTDVLVIGGGISGLLAGIYARNAVGNVLVVDKGGIGWSGQVPVSGGDCALIRPQEGKDHFKWLVEAGDHLNNQDWTYAFAHEMYQCIRDVADMGLPFWMADGELVVMPFHRRYVATHFSPPKFMIKLKQLATKKGLKTLDKVFITDLIRKDSTVTGAMGFGLVDGKLYTIKARATIIANGSCRYHGQRHFSVNTGEGVAMAYRAGAHLMNAEFSNTYTFGFKGDIRRRTPLYLFFENVLGDRFIENYYPEIKTGLKSVQEFLDFYRIADAMTKEVEAGRGPIYIDFRKLTHEERGLALHSETLPAELQPVGRGQLLQTIRERLGVDPDSERVEVELQFVGGQGPIKIDVDCRTTVDGLWAVGDASSLGSGYTGARSSGTYGGFGVAFGIVSGLKGGRNAGQYAVDHGPVKDESGSPVRAEEEVVAPLHRSGTADINDVIYTIHEAVIPVKYSLHRTKERLIQALAKVNLARNMLGGVGAKDYHELSRYHQADSMALSAEMTIKSALMREESRGTHRREEYPARDDSQWLKWILIKEEKGEVSLSTEPVPVEMYALKP